jgi:hypothetical protein
MATIYNITGDWLRLYDMADDPDIDADVWFDTMEAIEGEIEEKADATAALIAQLKAESDAIKAEADRLAARAKSRANKAEWLKKGLEKSMLATGKTKFKTERFSFGIQKNAPSLKFADNFDINSLPAEFIKFADPEVDKTALKDALKAGGKFEGCYLEQGEGLRIR